MRSGIGIFIGFLALVLLTACASKPVPMSSTEGTTLVRTGRVVQVRDITVHGRRNSGIGSLVGGVLGGVAGSTIGSGSGSAVAAVGGAVAGSLAGQHMEQSGVSDRAAELTIEFDGGGRAAYRVPPSEAFREGDVVRVTTTSGRTRITR